MKLGSPYLAPGALASGLLLTLSLPDVELWPLAWVALVPLLAALEGRRPADAARAGFAAGLVHAVTTIYWVTYTMHTYGGLPWIAGAAVMLLLAAYLALYPAAWAAGVALAAGACSPRPAGRAAIEGVGGPPPGQGRVWPPAAGSAGRPGAPLPLAALLMAPCVWVGLEWVRSWLLTGFPWMLLGYSQYRQLPLIQVADLGGVYAVSFLVVVGNVAAYALWGALRSVRLATAADRKRTGPAGGSPRSGGAGDAETGGRPRGGWPAAAARAGRLPPAAATAACMVALAAAFLGGSLVYGRAALARVEAAASAATGLPVGVAQGNIEQGIKWDPAYQSATVEIYRSLTAELAAAGARLVVWPETAVPAFFQSDPRVRPVVLATARTLGVSLLVGAPSAEPRPGIDAEGNPRYALFNSAYLIGADGSVLGRYDKHHLVPFGEYVPLSGLLFFVNKLAHGIGDFEAGRGTPTLPAGPARLGVVICYEAIFPDLVRRFAAGGATVLVNLTNDAWFGRTAAPWQHLAQAAFRAVESKLPLVRAANTGVSVLVAPSGRIVQQLGLFTRGTLAGTIPLPSAAPPQTLYVQIGDRFAQACTLAAVLGLAVAARTPRRAAGVRRPPRAARPATEAAEQP